jgi:hypothetical protein
MKVYPKKLRSVADLEREKRLLRKEAKELDDEPFFGSKDGKKEGDGITGWLYMLPVANPIISLLTRLIEKKFGQTNTTPAAAAQSDIHFTTRKAPGVKGLAIEVIGGYLKWKAIQLAYKAAKNAIKKRNEAKKQSQPD